MGHKRVAGKHAQKFLLDNSQEQYTEIYRNFKNKNYK